jgi:hypothetical protein
MRKIINWLLREYDLLASNQWGNIGSDEPGDFTAIRKDGIIYITPRRK